MIDQQDIDAARARIKGHVRRTPVMEAVLPQADRPVSFKLECLQRTGSFKARGAFNTLLSGVRPAAGVAAASGGNHGAAVACAAQSLGVAARIFVPVISAPVKIARIRAFGADVIVGGDRYADALAACDAYVAASGAHPVPAYDSDAAVAGQGTIGPEWEEDLRAGGLAGLDTVLVAVGGGGLVAGLAAWFGGRVRVVGVEPEGSRCLHAALEAGHPVDVPVHSIAADSLGARRVGDLPFAIASRFVDLAVLVSDEAIAQAQRSLWDGWRIAAEPGGAASFAALESGAYRPAPGERVGVLLCGGNVDPQLLAEPLD